MRVLGVEPLSIRFHLVFVCILLLPSTLLAQASYQAQLRGVVSDATGAVLPNATVTITEAGTNLSQKVTTGQS